MSIRARTLQRPDNVGFQTFEARTSAFYNSAVFKEKAKEAAPFLSRLPPYLDGRPVTLENMWNVSETSPLVRSVDD